MSNGKDDESEHDVDEHESDDYGENIDWDKQLERAIQFSLKKSEMGTRKSSRNTSNKLESLSLEPIKAKLLEVEEDYSEAARALNKAWAPFKIMERIKEAIESAHSEVTISKILLILEQGFSNPMSYKGYDDARDQNISTEQSASDENLTEFLRTNKIIEGKMLFFRNNRKIKKFWSSDTLKDCWLSNIRNISEAEGEENSSKSAEDENESADSMEVEISPMLFLCICIFVDQTETYIEKLNAKADKKKIHEEKKSLTKKPAKQQSDIIERKRKAGFYKEESSDNESEEEKPKNKRRKHSNESDFDEAVEEESEEMEVDDEEFEEEDDSNWDSN